MRNRLVKICIICNPPCCRSLGVRVDDTWLPLHALVALRLCDGRDRRPRIDRHWPLTGVATQPAQKCVSTCSSHTARLASP